MRIVALPSGFEVRNSPGALRGLGYAFVVAGLGTLALLLLGSDPVSVIDRIVVSVIGAGVAAGGIYAVATAPRTKLRVDTVARRICYERSAPFRRPVVVEAPLSAVRGFFLRQEHDSDGDPWYVLEVSIDGYGACELGGASQHGRAHLDAVAAAVTERLPRRAREVTP